MTMPVERGTFVKTNKQGKEKHELTCRSCGRDRQRTKPTNSSYHAIQGEGSETSSSVERTSNWEKERVTGGSRRISNFLRASCHTYEKTRERGKGGVAARARPKPGEEKEAGSLSAKVPIRRREKRFQISIKLLYKRTNERALRWASL